MSRSKRIKYLTVCFEINEYRFHLIKDKYVCLYVPRSTKPYDSDQQSLFCSTQKSILNRKNENKMLKKEDKLLKIQTRINNIFDLILRKMSDKK